MADDIIKSFLVKIGYKNDEYALKKVTEGITSLTKSVFALGAGITAVSTTVAYGVARIASNLERLFFASQRTGSSASSLKAFDLAAQRMGASAGQGLSAVEGLASFIRSNPMGASYVSQLLNVPIGQDQVKNMLGIADALQKMEFWQAKLYGSQVGLNEQDVLFLRKPEFARQYADMLKALGPNFEKATQDAHRFENALQLLETRLEGFGIQVIDVLQNKFGISIEKFSAWLDKNGERLTTSFVTGLQKFLGYLDQLAPKLEWLLDQLVKLDKATNGWSTVIIGLTLLFPGLVAGVVSLGVALAGLAIGGAAKGIGLLGTLGRLILPVGAGITAGALFDKYFPNNWLAQFGSHFGQKLYDYTHQKEHAMQVLSNYGFTEAQAAGIVANLNAESALQPYESGDHGKAYGIAQWHKEGQERFKKMFGFDIQGSKIDDQLHFLANDIRPGGANANVGRALQNANAAQSGQIFSRLYERPAAGETAALKRGEAAVQLYQQTHISVDGFSRTSSCLAKRVADAQDRRNLRLASAITREFASGTL